MNISYDKIMNSVRNIPDLFTLGGRTARLSPPFAREVDGKLTIIYMVYYFNDPNPDGFVLVDAETENAKLLSNGEAMERLHIVSFDEQPPEEAVDAGPSDDYFTDPGDDLEELFAESFGDDSMDHEAYHRYLGRLLSLVPEEDRPFYWALR